MTVGPHHPSQGWVRHLVPALSGAAALGLGVLLYASAIEARRLRVHRYAVTIPNLPAALEGTRLAYAADFHLHGPAPNSALTRHALETIVAEDPDLVFLGGDYFDHAAILGDGKDLTPIARLRGRVYAVLGNHDLRNGRGPARAITEMLEGLGVEVLRNRTVCAPVRDQEVIISGIDDHYTAWADLDAALAQVPSGERPLVLLSHAPTVAAELPVGAAALLLTGHTHGGQIRLSPSTHLTPLDVSYYFDRLNGLPLSEHQRGFHWVRGSLLYVSTGIGMTRWRLRFLAPPEVVFLHLTRQPADPSAPCDDPRRYVRRMKSGARAGRATHEEAR